MTAEELQAKKLRITVAEIVFLNVLIFAGLFWVFTHQGKQVNVGEANSFAECLLGGHAVEDKVVRVCNAKGVEFVEPEVTEFYSGITGSIKVLSNCENSTCKEEKPYTGVVYVISQDGALLKTVEVVGGSLKVDLLPGNYNILPENLTLFDFDRGFVSVKEGEFKQVGITLLSKNK